MPSLSVRSATSEDQPAIEDVVTAAYEHYIPSIGRRPAPMDADYAELIRRGQVWVAGNPFIDALFVVTQAEDHLLLENIAVRPSAQGSGLGTHVLCFVEELAGRWGVAQVRLYTNAAMTANLTFYQRRGYHETGRRREHGFERVFFTKQLPPINPRTTYRD